MVYLKRTLEVLQNFITHLDNDHNCSSYDAWTNPETEALALIKAVTPPVPFEKHKDDIKTALTKAEANDNHNF